MIQQTSSISTCILNTFAGSLLAFAGSCKHPIRLLVYWHTFGVVVKSRQGRNFCLSKSCNFLAGICNFSYRQLQLSASRTRLWMFRIFLHFASKFLQYGGFCVLNLIFLEENFATRKCLCSLNFKGVFLPFVRCHKAAIH